MSQVNFIPNLSPKQQVKNGPSNAESALDTSFSETALDSDTNIAPPMGVHLAGEKSMPEDHSNLDFVPNKRKHNSNQEDHSNLDFVPNKRKHNSNQEDQGNDTTTNNTQESPSVTRHAQKYSKTSKSGKKARTTNRMSEAFKAAKKDKNTLAALDSAVSMVANSAQEKTAHETSKPVVSMSINSVPQNPSSQQELTFVLLLPRQEDPSKPLRAAGQPEYERLTYKLANQNSSLLRKILVKHQKNHHIFDKNNTIAYVPQAIKLNVLPKRYITHRVIYLDGLLSYLIRHKIPGYEHVKNLTEAQVWQGLKTFVSWTNKKGYIRLDKDLKNLHLSVAVGKWLYASEGYLSDVWEKKFMLYLERYATFSTWPHFTCRWIHGLELEELCTPSPTDSTS